MTETFTPAAVQGSVPGDFQQVFRWRLSENPVKVIIMQILTIPLFLLGAFAFFILALRIGKFDGRFMLGIPEIGICLAAYAAIIVLHELVHGLTMRLFGARPQYGAQVKHLLFYATAPGYAFQRNAYILVALAPLVVLNALAILGMYLLQGTGWVTLLAFCAALNAGGAAGDLWMTSMILRYSRTVFIVDERDGFRVLIRKEFNTPNAVQYQ